MEREDENTCSRQWLSDREICERFEISPATWKNWRRLGKADIVSWGSPPRYEREAVLALERRLFGPEASRLKSRRNKRKITGNDFYGEYLKDAENREAVRFLLQKKPPRGEGALRMLLTEAALQLFCQSRREKAKAMEAEAKEGTEADFSCFLEAFIEGRLTLWGMEALFWELLGEEGRKAFAGEKALLKDLRTRPLRFVFGEDLLGCLYLSLSDLGRRKARGAYYTPGKIADRLLEEIGKEQEERIFGKGIKICDPCCGTGIFLIRALEMGVGAEALYGQDQDLISLQIARINLALHCPGLSPQLLRERLIWGNTLKKSFPFSFDLVLGNPPWGGSDGERDMAEYAGVYKTAASGKADVCDLFVERTLEMAAEGGRVALVLPRALLQVASRRPVRDLLAETCRFSFMVYLGNAFAGVQCPAVLLGVEKKANALMPSASGEAARTEEGREKNGEERTLASRGCRVSLPEGSFVIGENRRYDRSSSQRCFSFFVSDREMDCLRAMKEKGRPVYLKGKARFGLGIVTGNNRKYLSQERGEEGEPVLRGRDIFRFAPPRASRFLFASKEGFQQAAPEALYRAPEKLVYRFIAGEPVVTYDESRSLTLNSCNILIPMIPEMDILYVLGILNSRAVSFFCRKSFFTEKLLRSHLEQIPIPLAPAGLQRAIIRQVKALLRGEGADLPGYERLDKLVMEAYGLEEDMVSLIRQESRGRRFFLKAEEGAER